MIVTLADLSQAVKAYRDGKASFDEFADWYCLASRCKFAASQEALAACLAVDAALSELYYGEITEELFHIELEAALKPSGTRSRTEGSGLL